MRARRTAIAAAALVLSGLAVPTHTAVADEATPAEPPAGAPVTTADRVVIPADGAMSVDVLANDTDPDDVGGDSLTVCRAEPDPDVPVQFFAGVDYDETDYDIGGHPVLQVYPNLAKPGTYQVTYYVCDFDYLTPATLTVKVTPAVRPYAETIPSRPGFVRFHNPGKRRAVFQYGSPQGDEVDGKFALKPATAKAVRVRRTEIIWTATVRTPDGPATTGGYLADIEQPARVSRSVVRPPARTFADRSAWRLGVRSVRLRSEAPRSRTQGAPTRGLRDESTDAPVTQPDSTDVPRGFFAIADPLANDTDPDGAADDLGICRATAPAGSGLQVSTLVGGGGFVIILGRGSAPRRTTDNDPVPYSLLVQPGRGTRRGTYEVTYYACDHEYLTPGTLTVTVGPSQDVTAHRVKGKRGVVRFTNPGPHGAFVEVFAADSGFGGPEGKPLLRFSLPGGTSRNVRPHTPTIVWFAHSRRGPGGWGYVGGLGRPPRG